MIKLSLRDKLNSLGSQLDKAIKNLSYGESEFEGNCGAFAIGLAEVLWKLGDKNLSFICFYERISEIEGKSEKETEKDKYVLRKFMLTSGYSHVLLKTSFGVFDASGLMDETSAVDKWTKIIEEDNKEYIDNPKYKFVLKINILPYNNSGYTRIMKYTNPTKRVNLYRDEILNKLK